MEKPEAALAAGMSWSWTRSFTSEEVRLFAELSGDKGSHHLEPDEKGRLLLHGLLTATLPTKLGGDLDYLARSMNFEFLKPAYSGQRLTCTGTVESVIRQSRRLKVKFSFSVANEAGETVLKGSTSGTIFDRGLPP